MDSATEGIGRKVSLRGTLKICLKDIYMKSLGRWAYIIPCVPTPLRDTEKPSTARN